VLTYGKVKELFILFYVHTLVHNMSSTLLDLFQSDWYFYVQNNISKRSTCNFSCVFFRWPMIVHVFQNCMHLFTNSKSSTRYGYYPSQQNTSFSLLRLPDIVKETVLTCMEEKVVIYKINVVVTTLIKYGQIPVIGWKRSTLVHKTSVGI
jgi:hypothetical protein